jgi:hypothetical protein
MNRSLLCFIAILLASPPAHAIPTENGGQAYIDECRAAGVPKPPDWPSPGKWIKSGNMDRPLNPHNRFAPRTFASPGNYAEVYYYDSRVDPAQPPGVCFALPRFNESSFNVPTDTIALLGIICQGQASGSACFWDNSEDTTNDGLDNGRPFTIGRNEFVPIVGSPGVRGFAGGIDLFGAEGGACTECHAGENIFIIHPKVSDIDPTPLALGDELLKPELWPTPIVPRGWPDNPGPGNPLDGVASTKSCGGGICHGPSGHRFPQLSRELFRYCALLELAIQHTMPAFQILTNPNKTFVPAADDPDYSGHINALRAACASDPPLPAEEIMEMMD